MREINELRRLVAFVKRYSSQKLAAAAIGVSQPFLSQMLTRKRPIPEKVLKVLGLTRSQSVMERKT